MGLFSSSSSSSSPTPSQQPPQPSPTPTSDGAFIAPNRQSRATCYAARDTFFACLERNGIVDSIKEKERVEKVCKVEGEGLERECVGSWVTYFKQRRVMEHNRKETLEKLAKEDASKLPGELPPPRAGMKGGGPSS